MKVDADTQGAERPPLVACTKQGKGRANNDHEGKAEGSPGDRTEEPPQAEGMEGKAERGPGCMTGNKTKKVLDINVEGVNFVCIFAVHTNHNPYMLFIRWYDGGWHRKQLARYQNFVSVICHIHDYCFENHWGFVDWFD